VSKIELHIERLIVEGIPLTSGTPRQLQAGVESELRRLLGAGGLSSDLTGGIALPSLPGPALQLHPTPSALELGRQIADSVYRAIGGDGSVGGGVV
jgi:hypothetical protein